jgi:hypothetical protein
MHPLIVLLTDFGHADPYVGQMKGALLRTAPQLRIVDLCHEVQPHNIDQASFLLRASREYFPVGSIFICVVDPGVGSGRSLILARQGNTYFLAPDNGLLSFLLDEDTDWWRIETGPETLGPTFHGRDILAPAAARLATGEKPDVLGPALDPDHILRRPPSQALLDADTIECTVLHVDRFGNCLLNLPVSQFELSDRVWHLGQGQTATEVRTYADLAPGQIGLLAGSQGVMELALNQGSCAIRLDLAPGRRIRLLRTRIGSESC